jgi:methyl-accepting chemotaxis protein
LIFEWPWRYPILMSRPFQYLVGVLDGEAMNKFSIKFRLTVLVGTLLLFMAVSGLMALHWVRSVNASLATVYNDRVVPLKQLKAIADDYGVKVVDTVHKVVNGSMTSEAGLVLIRQAHDDTAKLWAEYKATYLVERETQLVKQAEPLMTKADEASRKITELLQSHNQAELQAFAAKGMYEAIDPIADVMDKLIDVQLDVAKEEYESGQATFQRTVWGISALTLLSIAVGLVAGWVTMRSIVDPILRAVGVAQQVASGDLSTHIQVDGQDETAQLLQALQQMNAGLMDIVSRVRDSSDSIATGSTQIAQGNADLSHRTEQQAANLEETAASMEELTSTVQHNSETTRHAAELADSACATAAKGGDVVGHVVQTMATITDASRKISDIISVIDGIAFQTNILALNAAVEAARAGEQGRGFAVVAGEVRTLAQRSAQAAKEIKSLIVDSVEKVDNGAKLVHEAGETMGEIVSQVRRVSELIADISHATSEQSSGINQVGQAVNQLDQVTQQNAALVEQSAAAAESLKHQASALADVVSTFRLKA